MLVDVILPLGPAKALSYALPPSWKSRIRIGMCVQVPLRKQCYTGIVWRCPGARYRGAVEPLLSLLHEKPLFSAESLRFFEWLSAYYMVPLNEVLKHSLPTKLQKGQGFSTDIQPVASTLPHLTPPPTPQLNTLENLLATKKPVLWPTLAAPHIHPTLAPLIANMHRHKQSVLYLVPDARLIRSRRQALQTATGLEAAPFHAQQTTSVHTQTWRRVAEGYPLLLLGSKSAVLLPFHQLGLVIIEEEQHSAYKEDKRSFGYHTRDSALMLAHQHQAACLVLSPSPSLESQHNLRQHKYQSLEATPAPLAPLQLLSLQEEKRKRRLTGTMSRKLYDTLRMCLDKAEPVLVFHPRKGYPSCLCCDTCSLLWRCADCGQPCRYSPSKPRPCEHCGAHNTLPTQCPRCQGTWKTHKAGTESVEEVLQTHFPQARIAQWNAHTQTPTQTSLHTLFHEKKIDILVSTPRYLYGCETAEAGMFVLWDAERWLQTPDFRSQERLFQWVLSLRQRFYAYPFWVQTRYRLELPFFTLLANADYNSFVQQELTERKAFGYPPYTRLLRIRFQHKNPQVLGEAVQTYCAVLDNDMPAIEKLQPDDMTKQYRKKHGKKSAHTSPYSVQSICCKLPKTGNSNTLAKKKLLQACQSLKKDARFQAISYTFDIDV